MDAKLTLKLDKAVIEEAKKYASSHKRSLSRIIESYLRTLSIKEKDDGKDEVSISQFVNEMSAKSSIPSDFDYKSDRADFLIEKYK